MRRTTRAAVLAAFIAAAPVAAVAQTTTSTTSTTTPTTSTTSTTISTPSTTVTTIQPHDDVPPADEVERAVCADYRHQEDAQEAYEAAGGLSGNLARLDADKDGIACQRNPKRATTDSNQPARATKAGSRIALTG